MDLQLARDLIDATLAEGRRRDAKPLAVVMLDEGGNMVACAREDGASFGRLKLAEGKAWGSLSLGFGSRTLSEKVGSSPSFFAAAASLLDGRLLPSPGGLLLFRSDKPAGAIGVSGDTGDVDETCAIAAATSLGLSIRT
jgi:uncharacterized protein GlcG (DUF336 family)